MKLAGFVALSMLLVAGCGSGGSESGSAPPPGSGSPAVKAPGSGTPAIGAPAGSGASGFARGPAAGGTGAAPAAAAGDSFFAGAVPAGVTMKPTKTFAMDPGILFIQGVEGWSGGQLPGYDYMAMSKDTTAVARVASSTGVTGQMGCKEISTAAAMAPLRAKNLKETSAPVMRKVGKNQFVAREGTCSGDGPKGPVEIHFLNILRKMNNDLWHYAVLVGFPPDAPQQLKNEAMAWARSLEYGGGNGYTMP